MYVKPSKFKPAQPDDVLRKEFKKLGLSEPKAKKKRVKPSFYKNKAVDAGGDVEMGGVAEGMESKKRGREEHEKEEGDDETGGVSLPEPESKRLKE